MSSSPAPKPAISPGEAADDAPVLDIYDKFSKKRKNAIVAVVAFAALLAPFASSAFLPSIPQISHDLRTSESAINYTVAAYLVIIALAPLVWSSYATVYGRRPIYLCSMPIFVAGSIGVAESRTLLQLIFTRMIQGIGASSVLSVGAGSIGDIYRPTERGRAMGLYLAGAQLGPPLAPVIGGIMTEYAHGARGTWRAFQYLLAAMGLATFVLAVFFLPETSHGRGIDAMKAAGRRGVCGTGWVWLNPLGPLRFLRARTVLAITLNSSFVLLSTYCILVPLPYTLGPRFGITNSAILGTLYLAQGGGNIVGSFVSGRLSDRSVHRWIARRSGVFIPEDRLRASLWAGGIATPLTLLGAGLAMQLWTSAVGLAVTLVFLFINGIGLLGILAVSNTYLVDTNQARSTEVIAANKYLCSAGASAAVLPVMKAIGIAPTNAIAAGFAWIGCALVVVVIRHGAGWRHRNAEDSEADDGNAEKTPADGEKSSEVR